MVTYDVAAVNRRRTIPSRLVYSHCNVWWDLDEGSVCPMEHDNPLARGRKRRIWICPDSEDSVSYLSRKEFLEHEDPCYAF